MHSISFILPSTARAPIGGFKVIYEYANRLSAKGYVVNLVHPYRKEKTKNIIKYVYRKIRLYRHKQKKDFGPDTWFQLSKEVNLLLVPYLNNKYIPNADYIVATEYSTAKPVLECDNKKGKKYYFIQSLETWLGEEESVINSWKYDLRKIVISKWLKNYASALNESAVYIPNGFNFEEFGIDIPPSEKNKREILMLYHLNPVKGSMYGINALIELKKKYSDLNVNLFSAYPRSREIPDWINYYYRPTKAKLRELYNSASIFISPSIFEGFPLPPAEAMICGCAVIATNIGGHQEYCIEGQTALLVPTKSTESIILKVSNLLDNQEFRIKIAENGNAFIQKFNWDVSIEKFISALVQF